MINISCEIRIANFWCSLILKQTKNYFQLTAISLVSLTFLGRFLEQRPQGEYVNSLLLGKIRYYYYYFDFCMGCSKIYQFIYLLILQIPNLKL